VSSPASWRPPGPQRAGRDRRRARAVLRRQRHRREVGQYTDFGGIEGRRSGGVIFCGEHTTQDHQGFMEGGAFTGVQAAKELIDHLG
jgi:hypothetical protein